MVVRPVCIRHVGVRFSEGPPKKKPDIDRVFSLVCPQTWRIAQIWIIILNKISTRQGGLRF